MYSYLSSHYHFQVRTFWYMIIYSIVGTLTLEFVVGGVIILYMIVWYIVRNVKGLIWLGEKKAVANPSSFFGFGS